MSLLCSVWCHIVSAEPPFLQNDGVTPGYISESDFLSLTPDATNISAFLLASSGVILAVGTNSNKITLLHIRAIKIDIMFLVSQIH